MGKPHIIILSLLFTISACESDKLHVDVSSVEIQDVRVYRLEQDMFGINTENVDQKTQQIIAKYGVLYEHFLMNPLRLLGSNDAAYKQQILAFTSDADINGAYKDAQTLYGNIEEVSAGVQKMAKRFHFHFPERPLPKRFVTCITGWNYAVAYMDSSLLLSLDMYLGDTSRFYQMLRYPQYQARKMNRAHILPDIARGWLLTEMDTAKPENTLLHHTIFYGKLFYAVQALLPETSDSLIIGYSSEQMKTCKTYEKQYWGYMAEKNRLYENSLTNIRELTSEGPFTGAISKECPPRIAMWIGWQIVRSYMENNDKVSLNDLMKEQDAQKILNKSKYRP